MPGAERLRQFGKHGRSTGTVFNGCGVYTEQRTRWPIYGSPQHKDGLAKKASELIHCIEAGHYATGFFSVFKTDAEAASAVANHAEFAQNAHLAARGSIGAHSGGVGNDCCIQGSGCAISGHANGSDLGAEDPLQVSEAPEKLGIEPGALAILNRDLIDTDVTDIEE